MGRLLSLALVVVVIAIGLAGSLLASGDIYGRLPHGVGFRNVRDYGAKGDGVTDDTQAFIKALQSGRGTVEFKSPTNVYVPAGKYLISDTLIVWRATMLAGDVDNPPTLILKENSPGFGDPSNPKPFVVTAGGYNVPPDTRDWVTRTNAINGSTNNTFFITIRDLNIRIGNDNPGAWGLYWLVAQQSSLRNMTIDAGDAQGCLKYCGTAMSHMRLIGGDYGWWNEGASCTVFRSIELNQQRKESGKRV